MADLNKGQLVILSTNRPHVLDKALVRSGRVDLEVQFPRPSKEDIVEMYSRWYGKQVESALQLMAMADEFSSLLPLSAMTVSEVEGDVADSLLLAGEGPLAFCNFGRWPGSAGFVGFQVAVPIFESLSATFTIHLLFLKNAQLLFLTLYGP